MNPAEKLRTWLEPKQDIVTILLVFVAVFALYMALFQRDAIARTGTALWFLLP